MVNGWEDGEGLQRTVSDRIEKYWRLRNNKIENATKLISVKVGLHWGLFCTGHEVVQVELSLLTTPVIFSTCLSTIACTLSMLSRLSPSRRPCIADIWLLALRRLADILFSFTWDGPEQEEGEGRGWNYFCAQNTKQVDDWSHQPPFLFFF